MQQQNGQSAAGKQSAKHSRASSRVVPAIPLPLSKPRPARPQPKSELNAKVAETLPDTTSAISVKKEVYETPGGTISSQENGQPRALEDAQEDDPITRRSGTAGTSIPGSTARGSVPAGILDASVAGDAERPRPLANGRSSLTSPSLARKPVDRSDMRPIRTELPPAFIPSVEQQSATQPTSSLSRQQGPVLPHAHPRHPSASNIVFGGRDSNSASPAPPISAGSGFAPPGSFPQPSSGQPAPPGYGHHGSESQRVNQQTHPQWSARSANLANGSSHHPHAHMPFRYPPREQYTSNSIPNGHDLRSRSGSQTSSANRGVGAELQSPVTFDHGIDSLRTTYPDPTFGNAGQPRHAQTFSQHQVQMTPPPPFAHPDFATGLENAESLRDHTLSQFRRPEFSDCHLQIAEVDGLGRQYLDSHRMILARSATLLSIIRNSEASTAAKSQIQVLLKGRYVRVGPFLEAVRYLYGGPLPSPDTYGPSFAHLGYEERMEVALQHIATGAWLRIAAIAGRGVEMAASLLNWESLSSALTFALDGGIGQMWPIEDGSEEISTCSSDDSLNKPEAGGSPTHDPYSSGLLHRIIEFIVQNLPPNFYLDPIAPQLASCPRLPAVMSHESKPSHSDPRLVKIRFGEFEDEKRPSHLTTTMSSILLSLPFPLLKFLLEHPMLSTRLGPETVSSIMRQVVNEREVRRQRALKARTINVEGGHDRPLVQNLYWEESVEQSTLHKAGFRLARKRRGIDTPPSSGAGSERAK